MFNDKANKYRQTMNRKLMSDVDVIKYEERTMNCPFSVIMVPVLCPSQVQYYDNWRLAVTQVMLMTDNTACSLSPVYEKV